MAKTACASIPIICNGCRAQRTNGASAVPSEIAFIQLKNGPIVRADAIALAIALEESGHKITAQYGKLFVSNSKTLSPEIIEAIKRVRYHVIAIALYRPPEEPRGRKPLSKGNQ
jgi:hypothetical protein